MKGKKVVLPVLLTSMVASPVIANISTGMSVPVFAEVTNVNAPKVSVKSKFDESHKRGVQIPTSKMPEVAVETGVEYMVIAVSPNGKQVAEWYSNPTNEQQLDYANATFTPTLNGTYKFVFRAVGTGGSVTLCDDVYLNVVEDSYTLNSVVNDYWALPSTVATGAQLGLGVPTFAINGVTQDFADFVGTVDQSTGDVDGTGIVVSVQKPDGLVEYITDVVAQEGEKPAHYQFTAAAAGTYTIKYEYYKDGKKLASIAKKTLRAVTGYNAADQYKLEFTPNSSIDSVSKVLGTTITLPTVKAINSKASATTAVSAFTKITVTYLGGSTRDEDKAIVGTDAAKQVVTDYTYTYKWAGNYQVEYEVSIPNLGVKATVWTSTIKGVADTVKPTIKVVSDYTWNSTKDVATFATGEIDLNSFGEYDQTALNSALADYNLAYNLNTVYELDGTDLVTVTIPAMFATDNYDTPSAIRLEREVYRSGAVSDKLIRIDDDNNDPTKSIDLTFGLESAYGVYKYGKFVVRYYAYDTAHPTSSTTLQYTFEVKTNGSVEQGAPTVNMQYFDITKVAVGDTITLKQPTATDYKSQSENLDVRTYYYVGHDITQNSDLLDKVGAGATELMASSLKDGKYSFTLASAEDTDKLYVFATAQNKYHADKGLVVRTFNIKGVVADAAAPNFEVVEEGTHTTYMEMLGHANYYDVNGQVTGLDYDSILDTGLLASGKAPFGQTDVVKLPAVKFTDNLPNGMDISVKLYYNAEGDYKNTQSSVLLTQPSITNVDGENLVYIVNGGSFEASYAGMYTVVYTATDMGGNTTSIAYGIMVNDTVAPTIVVVDKAKFSGDHEVGTQFTVPEAQIRDNGVLQPIDASNVTWTLEAPNNSRITYNGTEGFTPYTTGDYYVYYTAEDASHNVAVSQKYHINVVATGDLSIDFATTDYDTEYTWEEDTTSKVIRIPNAVAVSPNVNENVEVVTTVKDSNGKAFTVTYKTEEYSEFEATAQGVYTVTYTAQDKYGRTNPSFTLDIEVGDCEKPVATWKSSSYAPASEVKVGATWKFDVYTMMDVTDNSGNTLTDGITYTQTMRSPSGTVVSATDGTYTFNEVGTYTFTVTFKDKAGNSYSFPDGIQIVVTANDENSTTHTSNVVSTVLIVASVVVLAGVVTYFVLSGRKKTTKAPKKEDK